MERDRRNSRQLRRDGWRVLRVWEHELKTDAARVLRKIRNAVV
jgi:DNA mismatch endonuclease (patch repair protein)